MTEAVTGSSAAADRMRGSPVTSAARPRMAPPTQSPKVNSPAALQGLVEPHASLRQQDKRIARLALVEQDRPRIERERTHPVENELTFLSIELFGGDAPFRRQHGREHNGRHRLLQTLRGV